MSPQEFEDRIVTWANNQPDVECLVIGGSRAARDGGVVDRWADWDFQIVTRSPMRYFGTDWLTAIAPCWCSHSERTPRGVIKVSAIFEGGLEADFVPLAAWQMKLVYFAMKYPDWAQRMPRRLLNGVQETRGFLLGSGYRLIKATPKWSERLEALKVSWPGSVMTESEFNQQIGAFWQKAVWVFKKIARPEPRSAMHWLHMLVANQVYTMLAEEARLGGRIARPEARKAERWLDAERLDQTVMTTSLQQSVLAKALHQQISLFSAVTRKIAGLRSFTVGDYSAVEQWLLDELLKLQADDQAADGNSQVKTVPPPSRCSTRTSA